MRAARFWTSCVTGSLVVLAVAGCSNVNAPYANSCSTPAPLLGSFDPKAPDYIVRFHDNVSAVPETDRLASLYRFVPSHVYTNALSGFSAPLSSDVLASVRCETSVADVEYDSAVVAQ